MSKINEEHIFTSESVSEGHPDKVADQISDAVLDACLEQDPESRVACEVLTTTNLIVVSGEITTKADVVWEKVTRDVVREIGYNDPDLQFTADGAKLLICVHSQSPDISQGVTAGEGKYKEQGAGDQGIMFGYATNETKEYLPAPLVFSNRILEELTKIRKSVPKHHFLRPDSKSQVSVKYRDGVPVSIESVVVSQQHSPDISSEYLEEFIMGVCERVLPPELLTKDTKYYINPTGRFEIGGPHGDTGLTGRKIIVDTYGGVGSHGGGAFSGKDPSKVDRSAAYMCRHVAKNIVVAGLADKCEIQVAYAIGVADPVSVNVCTYGTGVVSDSEMSKLIDDFFNFRPASIIQRFGLKTPKGWNYKQTAALGHFGRNIFTWESIDTTFYNRFKPMSCPRCINYKKATCKRCTPVI